MNSSSISSALAAPASATPIYPDPMEVAPQTYLPPSATRSPQESLSRRSINQKLPADQIAQSRYNHQVMSCLYKTRQISDAHLLLHMIRDGIDLRMSEFSVTVSMDEVRAALQPLLPDYPLIQLLYHLPAKHRVALFDRSLFCQLLKTNPEALSWLPAQLRTPELLDTYINDHKDTSYAIAAVLTHHPEHPVPPEILARQVPDAISQLPPHLLTEEIKRLAVSLKPAQLLDFREDPDPGYTRLCMAALNTEGAALEYIPRHRITEDMVTLALETEPVAAIADIPECWRSDELCLKALKRSPVLGDHNGSETIARYYPENFLQRWPELMPHRKRFYHWLAGLPEDKRTEEMCQEFVQQFPKALHLIPQDIRDKHPEWRHPQKSRSLISHFDDLTNDKLTHDNPDVCHQFLSTHGLLLHVTNEELCRAPPAWMCLQGGPPMHNRWLPPHLIERLVRYGGPDGPADLWGTRLEPISADALLCPAQELSLPLEAARVPALARKRLMFCYPFVLRHQELGWQLQSVIKKHCQTARLQLKQAPLWLSNLQAAPDWQVHGGRVLCQTRPGPCRRLKFLRAGEKLDEWLAEYAVQDFALQHQRQLGLRSEIPQPRNYWRVPEAMLPDPAARGMRSRLEVHSDAFGNRWYLAFEFTTRDQDYSHLAWQKDANGSCARAEEGMARTFHDLGIWSSLGVVHISTANLLHNFKQKRPEIVLPALLALPHQQIRGYPGSLGQWDSQATDQSDWGLSGLRDMGDVEFYGTMQDFRSWHETDWQFPSFDQRAAFMNTLCSNLLVGLLHYMRLHRDAPDWYYKNDNGCLRLQCWINDNFTSFIQGLLGDDTRLEQLFPGPACYRQWLENTAREILYWSARQNRKGEECFAVHLREYGRPCPSLYPEHPTKYFTYPEDFTDEQGRDHLAYKSKKMPLFSLVRGFYLLAYKLADRLEGPDPMPSDSMPSAPMPSDAQPDSPRQGPPPAPMPCGIL